MQRSAPSKNELYVEWNLVFQFLCYISKFQWTKDISEGRNEEKVARNIISQVHCRLIQNWIQDC